MSGLSHTPGKRARGKTLRGFESRLLRQCYIYAPDQKCSEDLSLGKCVSACLISLDLASSNSNFYDGLDEGFEMPRIALVVGPLAVKRLATPVMHAVGRCGRQLRKT